MGAGSKSKPARRKKRISKHMLKSREALETTITDDNNGPLSTTTDTTTTTKPSSKSNKVKDPSEAKSYLSLWKADKSSWKFNKNTQSWLIRHMYQVKYVDKETFNLMCDYLGGMKGQSSRDRVSEDAKRRALRYKDWEKKKKSDDNDAEVGGEDKDDGAENEGGEKTVMASSTTSDEDDKEWNSLDDHEKRREYKRARRVIDVFKVSTDEEKEEDADDKE